MRASAGSLLAAIGAASGPRASDDAGADVVIDAVGAAATRQLAVESATPHGTVVLIGMHDDSTELAFRPIVRDEIVICGSYAYADADFRRAAQWIADGEAGPGWIEATRPLVAGPELFAELARGGAGPVRMFLGDG